MYCTKGSYSSKQSVLQSVPYTHTHLTRDGQNFDDHDYNFLWYLYRLTTDIVVTKIIVFSALSAKSVLLISFSMKST